MYRSLSLYLSFIFSSCWQNGSCLYAVSLTFWEMEKEVRSPAFLCELYVNYASSPHPPPIHAHTIFSYNEHLSLNCIYKINFIYHPGMLYAQGSLPPKSSHDLRRFAVGLKIFPCISLLMPVFYFWVIDFARCCRHTYTVPHIFSL